VGESPLTHPARGAGSSGACFRRVAPNRIHDGAQTCRVRNHESGHVQILMSAFCSLRLYSAVRCSDYCWVGVCGGSSVGKLCTLGTRTLQLKSCEFAFLAPQTYVRHKKGSSSFTVEEWYQRSRAYTFGDTESRNNPVQPRTRHRGRAAPGRYPRSLDRMQLAAASSPVKATRERIEDACVGTINEIGQNRPFAQQ